MRECCRWPGCCCCCWRCHCCSWVLALVAHLHAAPRALKADGTFSEPIAGHGRPILAGCTSSASLALAVVFEPVEEAHARYPLRAPQCHIDDLCGVAVAFDARGEPLRNTTFADTLTDLWQISPRPSRRGGSRCLLSRCSSPREDNGEST